MGSRSAMGDLRDGEARPSGGEASAQGLVPGTHRGAGVHAVPRRGSRDLVRFLGGAALDRRVSPTPRPGRALPLRGSRPRGRPRRHRVGLRSARRADRLSHAPGRWLLVLRTPEGLREGSREPYPRSAGTRDRVLRCVWRRDGAARPLRVLRCEWSGCGPDARVGGVAPLGGTSTRARPPSPGGSAPGPRLAPGSAPSARSRLDRTWPGSSRPGACRRRGDPCEGPSPWCGCGPVPRLRLSWHRRPSPVA